MFLKFYICYMQILCFKNAHVFSLKKMLFWPKKHLKLLFVHPGHHLRVLLIEVERRPGLGCWSPVTTNSSLRWEQTQRFSPLVFSATDFFLNF